LVDDELEMPVEVKANPFRGLLPARLPVSFAMARFGRKPAVMANDFVCVVRKEA